MSDIFLSYKHAQRQEARQLSAAMAALGWTVWWDWNIPAGAKWQAELDEQLDAAGCVVVLWSADSLQSEWVLYEARSGLRSGKLVQALLEPVQPLPEFAALQAVDLAGWQYRMPFHAGFDRLRAAIRGLLDRRAPLAASRSGAWVRTSTGAGDVLRREPAAAVASRARPAPVMLLPPPFADLIDRGGERNDIVATLAQRRGVSLAGAPGSGKSALLYHIGNLDHTERFHDGVVYLQAASQGAGDLAQAVHEAFYDVAPGNRPSAVEIRRGLADKTALLILDDVALPAAGLDALSANAPGSSWVYASEQIAASAQRRPVALEGLPVDDGIVLFERALWRKLGPDERGIAARIVESVQGHPARIEQAAGVAAAHGVAAALSAIADTPNPAEQDAKSRRVLAALACGGDVPLEPEQCAAIAEVDGVNDVLAALVKRGLVQHAPAGFCLAAGVAPRVEAMPELAACRQRATRAFLSFAFQARGTPRRVARLAAPMTAQMAWAAGHERSAEALQLARALDGPLAGANRWDAWGDMLSRAHDIATRAGDEASAGWALHQQGTRALMLDDKREARRLLDGARKTRKRSGDTEGLRATGNNLRLLRWSRWAILLALLGGVGVTTLGALPLVSFLLRPIATVAPGNLDFGAQDVRAATPPQAIQIGNDGRATLELIGVTLQGPNAQSFAIGSSCDGIKVPPKLACRFLVEFKPDAVGPRTATVVVTARDVREALVVQVRGVGTATPLARLSSETVDFGEVEIGGGANHRLTLSNEGSAPLTATAVAIEGDRGFTIARNGCNDIAVAPQAQCAIDLRFAPTEAAAKVARLAISDNAGGSPRTVALSGVGHATPRLEVAPASLAFGRQEIGTQSAVRPVRVHNSGNVEIEIQRVSVQGSDAFRLQDRCAGARLAPGAQCVIDVRYAPTTIESSSGRIVIANSAGGARGVDLAGTGFGKPVIEVAPAQVDFGVLKRGAVPQPRRVTIGNAGSDALLLQAPRIDGDRRFSVTNGCPERLAPKARCSVDVGVETSGTGKLSARLIVAHNAAGSPTAVPLLGAIEAIPPPVIDRFTANPATLQEPGQVELCFRARFAQRLALEPAGSQPQSNAEGCVVRPVRATTTFRLTASGEGGTQQASTTVAVAPPPPPKAPVIVEFRADPALLMERGETRLCFRAQNAESALIAPGEPQPSSPNGGCVSRRVAATTTYTLTVTRQGSEPQRRDATVTVLRIPLPPTGGDTPPVAKPPIGTPPAGTPPTGSPPKRTPPTGTPPRDSTTPGEVKTGGGITNPGSVQGKTGVLVGARPLGWCCTPAKLRPTLTQVREAECAKPGQWFATEAQARQACTAPDVKMQTNKAIIPKEPDKPSSGPR